MTTGSVATYWSAIARFNGKLRPFGASLRPFNEFTFAGLEPTVKQFTLPAYDADDPAAPTKILDYLERENFSLVLVMTEDTHGYFELWESIDAETSASDPTPAGTSERVNQIEVNCTFPQAIHTPVRRVNTSLSVFNDRDGDGVPVGILDAGTEEGRVHAWYIYNRDSTKAVNVKLIMFPN